MSFGIVAPSPYWHISLTDFSAKTDLLNIVVRLHTVGRRDTLTTNLPPLLQDQTNYNIVAMLMHGTTQAFENRHEEMHSAKTEAKTKSQSLCTV